MRYLVLADVHANLEALEACLDAAHRTGFDETLVLGDMVGYGADPNAVIARIQTLSPTAIIRGNHDKVACGLDDAAGFNPVATRAVMWTRARLTTEHRDWLIGLPKGPAIVDDVVEICHGAPFDEDRYLFDEHDATQALHATRRPLCLFGHTHIQGTFEWASARNGFVRRVDGGTVELRRGFKYLVNPGSVGQPRDGDPRAAFAIVDTAEATLDLYRIRYPVEGAQAKIVDAGLPEPLARRLATGR